MEFIMDIVGEILEGIFEFAAKSSFKSLKKKFKGEESDERIVDEASNKGENGENDWNEVSEWNEVKEWNEVNEWNETDECYEESEEKQRNKKSQANQVLEINEREQVNYDNKSNCANEVGDLGPNSSLFEVYKSIKSKINKSKSYNNIKYKDNENIAKTNPEKNNKNDSLCNVEQSSNRDLAYNVRKRQDNVLSYNNQQNDDLSSNELVSNELNFNKEALRNAVIYSEILGKPKAKNKRRRKNWI